MITKDFSSYIHADEKFIKEVYKHPIIYLYHFLYLIVWILFYGGFFLLSWTIEWIIGDWLYWWIISLSCMFFVSWVLLSFIWSYFSIPIITDKRIIILQKSLFTLNITTVKYSDITELESQKKWILSTLLWFWTLTIWYMWWKEKSKVPYIDSPEKEIEIINSCIENDKLGKKVA